ncbi:MAG TPA: ribose 5-phosphate isomerase B [Pseudonocardia sp.]|jgi:ribose 5-phosphate isomerase B
MTEGANQPHHTIAVGADDAGLTLKELLAGHLRERGYQVTDYGTDGACAVAEDYPDIALRVAQAVRRGEHDRAILVCGTGIGMAITANKVPGVRAAQASDNYSAERARMSNDAQVLAIGARVVGPELAKSIVDTWLDAEFTGGRSAPKVDKMNKIDAAFRAPAGQPRA